MSSKRQMNLSDYSPRSLNLIGSIFANGCDVRVQLSERSVDPVVLMLETWTIVLNPKVAHLYDLALAATLLKHRADRKLGPTNSKRLDRWLTRTARKRWFAEAHQTLARNFPGIRKLPGHFLPGSSPEGLTVTDKRVEFSPLPKLLPRTTDGLVHLEIDSLPELEIRGAEGDTQWLLESLEAGTLPTQCIPGFEELPLVVVPFRLCTAESFALQEVFDEFLKDTFHQENVPAFIECYTRKSEVRDERAKQGRHTRDGNYLDMNRLLAYRLAKRVNMPSPPLFRKKNPQQFEPVFDGTQHCVVCCFDVNDLRRKADWEFDDPRYATQRMLVAMLTVYERLQTDFVLIGFADNMVELSDGRKVLLHARTVLKSIDQPFDQSVWQRLAQLFHYPPTFPGEPTCFHPASLADITQTFDDAVKSYDHSYRAIIWWARRNASSEFGEFRSTQFLQRVADHVDHEIAELERRMSGTLDTLASFLPSELKHAGRPGGYLSNIEI